MESEYDQDISHQPIFINLSQKDVLCIKVKWTVIIKQSVLVY